MVTGNILGTTLNESIIIGTFALIQKDRFQKKPSKFKPRFKKIDGTGII